MAALDAVMASARWRKPPTQWSVSRWPVSLGQLLEHGTGVADDAQRGLVQLGGIDVHLDQVVQVGKLAVPDGVVELGADHKQDVGPGHHVLPVPSQAERVVVGNGAPTLLTGDHGDARLLHECLQMCAGLGPEHTASGQYCRPPGTAQDLRCLPDERARSPQPTLHRPVPGRRRERRVFGTGQGVHQVDGHLQVDRAGASGHGMTEGRRDVVGELLDVLHGPRPFGHRGRQSQLVQRLHLAHIASPAGGRSGDAQHG